MVTPPYKGAGEGEKKTPLFFIFDWMPYCNLADNNYNKRHKKQTNKQPRKNKMIKVTVSSKKGIEVITLFGVKDIALAIANRFARIDKDVRILSIER